MSEWQPIETAPKDGTVILLYEKTEGVRAGWWRFTEYHNWAFVDDTSTTPKNLRKCRIKHNAWGNMFGPTHWQPLPEPP